MFSSVPLKND